MPSNRDLVLRRRRFREAVHGEQSPSEKYDVGARPLRGVEGTVIEASPHLLVLAAPDGSEVRVPIAAGAVIWHAGRSDVSALRPGRDVVVRPAGEGGLTAARIWVDISRVTGMIAGRSGRVFEVDAGPHRGRTSLVVPAESMSRIRVRHPQLEPGSLIDVIGVRRGGEIHGLAPATNSPQPTAHADRPVPGRQSGSVSRTLRGTATWYERPDGAYGGAYPALDPYGDGGGCGAGPASPLPILSIASEPYVRNDCTRRAMRVPVIECGCLAARFCDRCVRCGTSPRGRILELSRSVFVDLGGDLDAGCFNVTARVGR